MKSTLSLKDLSASLELDREAMSAVRGGADNQANGTAQENVQKMAAVANVGNASLFGGSATIESDNTFHQDADNTSYSANVDFASIGYPWYHRRG